MFSTFDWKLDGCAVTLNKARDKMPKRQHLQAQSGPTKLFFFSRSAFELAFHISYLTLFNVWTNVLTPCLNITKQNPWPLDRISSKRPRDAKDLKFKLACVFLCKQWCSAMTIVISPKLRRRQRYDFPRITYERSLTKVPSVWLTRYWVEGLTTRSRWRCPPWRWGRPWRKGRWPRRCLSWPGPHPTQHGAAGDGAKGPPSRQGAHRWPTSSSTAWLPLLSPRVVVVLWQVVLRGSVCVCTPLSYHCPSPSASCRRPSGHRVRALFAPVRAVRKCHRRKFWPKLSRSWDLFLRRNKTRMRPRKTPVELWRFALLWQSEARDCAVFAIKDWIPCAGATGPAGGKRTAAFTQPPARSNCVISNKWGRLSCGSYEGSRSIKELLSWRSSKHSWKVSLHCAHEEFPRVVHPEQPTLPTSAT